MKIVTVVGARPQFIKAASISRKLRTRHEEILVHTGQHYDDSMSQVFFDELALPQPNVNLKVGSGTHGAQTGEMLAGIEKVLMRETPNWVLVYGDTNSTLAGALAAAKLHIPVAHVEAGLRSFNRSMPEEINRILTDHISNLLFCPSHIAVEHLQQEGIIRDVHIIGDVMADALFYAIGRASPKPTILGKLGLTELTTENYWLVTIHRAENTDDLERLDSILAALSELNSPVVFPVHPRTRSCLAKLKYNPPDHVHVIDPLGYLDMVRLEQSARAILTDSGGIQKEAYWLGIPCITLRDETEWVETVESGWNILTGADKARILAEVRRLRVPEAHPVLYGGDGRAAERCVEILEMTKTDVWH